MHRFLAAVLSVAALSLAAPAFADCPKDCANCPRGAGAAAAKQGDAKEAPPCGCAEGKACSCKAGCKCSHCAAQHAEKAPAKAAAAK